MILFLAMQPTQISGVEDFCENGLTLRKKDIHFLRNVIIAGSISSR
jgi:hypothetical protein